MNIDIASKLFPNLATVIIQLIATGIMVAVFKKYLWKNVQAYMSKRAEFIEGNINEAKQLNERAKVFIQESEQQARMAAKEYHDIIEKAKEEANIVKQEMLAQANKEVKDKLEQAKRQIEITKAQQQEEMKKEIIDIAFEVATKVVNNEINPKTNQELVDQFIKDLAS